MILAAGRGTRLGELGRQRPKVLLEVAGQPLLDRHIEDLARARAESVVVNAHHLADQITAHVENGMWPIPVTVVVEPELLGTAGGVRNALPLLGDGPIVVVYGDVISDVDLPALVKAHVDSGADATLVVHPADDAHGKGIVLVDAEDRIIGFAEKPEPEDLAGVSRPFLINSGIYVMDAGLVRAFTPPSGEYDFGHEVFPAALAGGRHLRVERIGIAVTDIGTPESLAAAQGGGR